ncbi:MAG: NADPH:quinone oxidoreductase family protein [Chloroflexi bacterium]|nr:NADPH:quinone oxidoreductase family protein [Chloroflexota bacterium]
MRAVVCRELGGPEHVSLGDLPVPTVGPGEVGIAVEAAGVSFADVMFVQGKHQTEHVPPFAPGMEVAGRVVEVGQGVEGFREGDPVAALLYDGGHAEQATALATECFPIPGGLAPEFVAGALSVYLTAHICLTWEAALERGERVLVLGAGSGVGLAAVAVAAALGGEVVAAASSAEKLSTAEAAGAGHLVNYRTEDLREATLAATGGSGVDVVVDPVGAQREGAFRTLDWGGRYVVAGFAGGAVPQFKGNHLLIKNRRAVGMVLMHYRERRIARMQQSAAEVFSMFADGRLAPPLIEVGGLEDGPRFLQRVLDRDVVGKLVLRV